MKLNRYLNENEDKYDEIINIIKNEVNKEYLSMLNTFSQFIYRGTKKRIKDYSIITSRTDRKPKDMPIEVHNIIDKYLYKIFGWKPRSEGVFTSLDRYNVYYYGDPYLFFPLGDYKIIYSDIDDLFVHIKNVFGSMLGSYSLTNNSFMKYAEEMDKEELKDKILEILNNINFMQSKKVSFDIYSNKELVFNCKKYLLVDVNKYKLQILKDLPSLV